MSTRFGAPEAPPAVHVGMTRFSLMLPESQDWRLTRHAGTADPEAYAAHLYSEERMRPRLDIFCELAAPIYQQMAEQHSFRLLVQHSSVMPQRWTEQLQSTAEKYPVLQLVECAGNPPPAVDLVRSCLAATSPEQSAMVYAFRVDDDDLLAATFLDQVSPYLIAEHIGWALSFSAGYAGLYEQGRFTAVAQRQLRLTSMGQGAIGWWDAEAGELVLDPISNHTKTDRKRPVILDGWRRAFFQTQHVGQDTAGADGTVEDREAARAKILAQLAHQVGQVRPEAFYRAFPTLRGRADVELPVLRASAPPG